MKYKKDWIGHRTDLLEEVDEFTKFDIALSPQNRRAVLNAVFSCIDNKHSFTAHLYKAKKNHFVLRVISSRKIHFNRVVAAIKKAATKKNGVSLKAKKISLN